MSATVETVRGRLDDGLGEALVRFWTGHGVLDAAGARARLPEVVCLLRGGDGEVAGVSSAYAAGVDLLGGRRLWVFRSFVAPGADAGGWHALFRATFAALEGEFDPADPDAPIGVCAPLRADQAALRPEAEWPDPRTWYAGHLPDGRQLRVAYFDGASVVPGLRPPPDHPWDLDSGPRIAAFDEQDAVDRQAILDFWLREDAMPRHEAERRVDETHLVATAGDELVAVSTAYLRRNEQLGMDAWYYRGFVGEAHRMTTVGVRLGVRGREDLARRFAEGRDTRAGAMIFEVEHAGLRRAFPQALWLPTDFAFIGENERGDHVRVHYFPGAVAPVAAQGSA